MPVHRESQDEIVRLERSMSIHCVGRLLRGCGHVIRQNAGCTVRQLVGVAATDEYCESFCMH